MMAYLNNEKDAEFEMVGVKEFLRLNNASSLTPEVLKKFDMIPNSVDPATPERKDQDWQFFVDYVKPSRTVEVLKVV